MTQLAPHDDHPPDQPADFTTISWLLARPRLAHLYTNLLQMDEWVTTDELIEDTTFSQSTVYDDLADLRDTSLVSVRTDGRERHYRAEPFKLGVLTEGQLTTITPTIIAAVGQQAIDEDVAQFVEDYGIEKLVDVVSYVKPYVDGRMTERIAARELELSTVVGMTILIALEDTVRGMQEVDPFFGDVRDATVDGGSHPAHEIRFDEHTRVILESNDESEPTDADATDASPPDPAE